MKTSTITLATTTLALLTLAGCSGSGSSGGAPVTGVAAATSSTAPVPQAESDLVPIAMFQARVSHQVNVIGPDLALITGGQGRDGSPLDTAETVDVTTGQRFALIERMTTPRNGHLALTLPSGDVLLVGGDDDTQTRSDAELWSPSSGAFTPVAQSLSAPRFRPCGIVVGDQVIIAGGRGQASLEVWSASTLTRTHQIDALPGGLRPEGQLALLDAANVVVYYGGLEPAVAIDLDTFDVRSLSGPLATGGTLVQANLDGTPRTYVVGGDFSGAIQGGLQLVNEADAPEFHVAFTEAAAAPSVVGGDGFAFVVGGDSGFGPIERAEVVTANGSRRTAPLSRPRNFIESAIFPSGKAVFCGGLDVNLRPVAAMEVMTTEDFRDNPAFQQAIMERADFERRLAQLNQLNAQNVQIMAQIAALQAQILQIQDQIAVEQAKNLTLQNELNQRNAEVARLTAERDRLQNEINQLNAQIQQLQAQNAANQQAIQNAQNQLSSLQNQLSSTNSQLSSAQSQAGNLQNQLNSAQSTQNQLQNQANSLASQVSSQANSLRVTIGRLSARVVVVGGSFSSTVFVPYTSTNTSARVEIQVQSPVTFRQFTTIATNQPANGTYQWAARGQPGERFTFRAIARVGNASATSNTQSIQ